MNFIRISVLYIFFIHFPLFSQELNNVSNKKIKKIPTEQAVKIMEPILEYSISLGTGKRTIYAFIDPLCPHSRSWIDMVSSEKRLQEMYTYKFWLYRLPKFNSDYAIYHIYNSDDVLNELLMIMTRGKELNNVYPEGYVPNKEIIKKIQNISAIGEKLKATRRPTLFIEKRGK